MGESKYTIAFDLKILCKVKFKVTQLFWHIVSRKGDELRHTLPLNTNRKPDIESNFTISFDFGGFERSKSRPIRF